MYIYSRVNMCNILPSFAVLRDTHADSLMLFFLSLWVQAHVGTVCVCQGVTPFPPSRCFSVRAACLFGGWSRRLTLTRFEVSGLTLWVRLA